MRVLPALVAFGFLSAAAAPALAHPHIFVDTGLALTLDEAGRVTQVEVTWKYDDLYSLLIMQDRGLDEDADGALTEAELAQIDGWDMNWIEGYEGDLYLETPGGVPVALDAPQPLSTDVEDGRLISRHIRPLAEPVAADGLALRAFDPEFYTAYDLTLGVTVGNACTATVTPPDQDAAYREAREIMSDFPEDAVGVPMLGHVFAETVSITCSPAD